ncbi:MAG: NuoI/complex I 23 kDa subunit family protein [Promethearchaeota archaeon]
MPIRASWAGLKQLFKRRVTIKYPSKELELPKSERARHVFYFNRCISCSLCARSCPTAAITMIDYPREGKPKKHPQIDYGRCIFCGYCVDVCPKHALVHSRYFHLAARETDPLIYSPDQLAEIPEGEKHLLPSEEELKKEEEP